MKLKELRFEQQLPIDLKSAWDFFSSPLNLNEITPEDMNFEIHSNVKGQKMYPGMIIQYTVQPVAGIPLNWVTEITQVKEYEYFIDEQRFGPYSFWHHQHHFEENDTGVLMTDILHYGIPFGPMGKLADTFFVGKKVKEIFSFREQKLDALFPKRKLV